MSRDLALGDLILPWIDGVILATHLLSASVPDLYGNPNGDGEERSQRYEAFPLYLDVFPLTDVGTDVSLRGARWQGAIQEGTRGNQGTLPSWYLGGKDERRWTVQVDCILLCS